MKPSDIMTAGEVHEAQKEWHIDHEIGSDVDGNLRRLARLGQKAIIREHYITIRRRVNQAYSECSPPLMIYDARAWSATARCNPKDQYNRKVGFRLALKRALELAKSGAEPNARVVLRTEVIEND